MAGEFELKFDDAEWRAFLAGLQRNTRRADRMLTATFMTHGFADIIDHFKQEEGPDGKWQKRAPSTQQWYSDIQEGRRKPPKGLPRGAFDPANRLLQLTGRLRGSLLNKRSAIRSEGINAIRVFSNVEYSGKHDEGEGRIPARPFMWLSGKAMDKMAIDVLDLLLGEEIK